MGCYDTITVPCPNCGAPYEAQSKGGDSAMLHYTMADAPDDVMEDVNQCAPFLCESCDVVFEVDVKYRKAYEIVSITAEDLRKQERELKQRVKQRESPEVIACPACGFDAATLVIVCPRCKEEICYNYDVPAQELKNLETLQCLRAVEDELRVIKETAQAWLGYTGDDPYWHARVEHAIKAVLLGEKPEEK